MRLLALLLPVLALMGCCATPQPAGAVYALPAPAAACAPVQAAGPCASPLALASPCAAGALAAPADLGVVYSVDGASYIRAGFAIPAGFIACGGQFLADLTAITAKGLVCLGNSLTPPVTPTAHFVQLQRIQPATAGACAPAAGPCGR